MNDLSLLQAVLGGADLPFVCFRHATIQNYII
jgi:hypothetical protein